jgi:hypothetical protein
MEQGCVTPGHYDDAHEDATMSSLMALQAHSVHALEVCVWCVCVCVHAAWRAYTETENYHTQVAS